MLRIAELPYVDEHSTDIAADVGAVWPLLLDALDRSLSRAGMAGYTRIVGCRDGTGSGPRPLAEGSTIPGFRVERAIPGAELVLTGRHRFSSYALTFRLDPTGPGQSRLRAETRARFPGRAGGVYRLLVIGTGGHVIVVRRMLSGIKRRAEKRAK